VNLAQFGLAGALALALVGVIGYLLNSNRQDRAQHREIVADLRETIKINDERYEKRIRDVEERSRERIAELEKRCDVLEIEVQTERSQRLTAEQLTASERIRAAEAEFRLTRLQAGGPT
jgi:hypothetical protein